MSPADIKTVLPGPDTGSALREALGRFATGVTVVTADSEIGPLGMTANSFASVSLDPALVLWSPAKGSRRYDAFANATVYAIHILGANQLDLCRAFTNNGTAFDQCDWHLSHENVPLIDGCLARFECTRVATHDAGDHGIVVGQIHNATWRDGNPLVFNQGRYGEFNAH